MLRGEEVNLGVGMENPSARGTFVLPYMQVPARAATDINVDVTKVQLRETKVSGVASRGSEIVSRKAGGKLEFNLRSESIGFILKSLLGKCTTTPVSGNYKKHTFEILTGNPQYPTLSLAVAQAGDNQDYAYNGAIVKNLEIKTPVDDLVNATAEFIALDEQEHAAFSMNPSETDYIFRPQDISIKVATSIAGLATAPAATLNDLTLSITNNGKPQQVIGTGLATPNDNLAGILEITSEIVSVYTDSAMHDAYRDNTSLVMEITLEREDIELETGLHPKIVITLDKFTIDKYAADRPLDDIVTEKLSIVGAYSDEEEEAIHIDVYNTISSYDYPTVS